jgi:hypothetical protein
MSAANLIPYRQLADLITQISDVPAIWEGDPVPNVQQRPPAGQPAAQIWLAVRSMSSKGVADQIITSTKVNGVTTLTTTIAEYMPFVLRMTAKSYNDIRTQDIIAKVRIRMRRDSSRQALNALGIAFCSFEPAIDLDEFVPKNTFATKPIYVTQLDIHMAALNSDVVDDSDGSDIENVDGSAQVPGTPYTIPQVPPLAQ